MYTWTRPKITKILMTSPAGLAVQLGDAHADVRHFGRPNGALPRVGGAHSLRHDPWRDGTIASGRRRASIPVHSVRATADVIKRSCTRAEHSDALSHFYSSTWGRSLLYPAIDDTAAAFPVPRCAPLIHRASPVLDTPRHTVPLAASRRSRHSVAVKVNTQL